MEEKFESWCIVELFGHNQIAGVVTEQEIGGQSFVRVDVPECAGQKAFTKFFGAGAIYAITPVREEEGMTAVKKLQIRPVSVWTIPVPKLPYPEDEDEQGQDACNF